MRKLMIMLLCCVMLGASTAFAGSGHSHGPITKERAMQKAEKRLNRLVRKGKIAKSWAGKKAASVEKKIYNGKKEWVVTFKNPALKDKLKQNLYMFFKLDGHYLATNYTGK